MASLGKTPMCPTQATFWKAASAGILLLLISAGQSHADWMGFRNETGETLIIQETIHSNNVVRLGKPQKLLKGEAVRNTLTGTATKRRISIYDPKNPTKPLVCDDFPCPAPGENILYVIKSDGKGGITVEKEKPAGKP